MKRESLLIAVLVLILALPSLGASLGTSGRSAIPMDVQQIISVDYRNLRNSETAQALKNKVLPDNLKQFESALKEVGIDPEKQLEQLTFTSFRTKTSGLRIIGLASGSFSQKAVVKKLKLKKIAGSKYHQSVIYPMNGGMEMSFLDDNTLVFGEPGALKSAINTRDGEADSLNSNSQMTDMITAVEGSTVWSVLDQAGTQNMMRSALGDASKLADYETVKKRILGSHYTMDFANGVNFDLNVVTADNMTAAALSSVLKAGVLYRKMTGSATEKSALESVSVDNDSSNLKLHFKTDDKKFQALLQSDMFASVVK